MSKYHKSVLLHETIQYLEIKKDSKYIDATLGGGGHSLEILKRGGRVLGLDVDQDALDYVKERISEEPEEIKKNLVLAKGNFRNINDLAREKGFNKVAGILFDLGVSSHQLDTAERGFSFTYDAPLDMRMDRDLTVSAMDLLKVLSKGELYALFKEFGEENFSKRIATNIVESRRIKPIETTKELEAIIRKSIPHTERNTNPATRVFQALRIAVNGELDSISEALGKTIELLEDNGRIAVISFHSLEDRIVKHTFIDWEKRKLGKILTDKPIIPSDEEIKSNTRSRSSKLRVFIKQKQQ